MTKEQQSDTTTSKQTHKSVSASENDANNADVMYVEENEEEQETADEVVQAQELEDEASSESDVAEDEVNEDDVTEDSDTFYNYLVNEHHKYRMWALVLAIVGFATIIFATGLSQAGMLQLKIYNLIMSIANFFIILMAIVIFTRVRPFKRKIKMLNGEALHTITDPDAPDGVRMEEGKFRDMDDMYKILERKGRTEVIPDIPEYHQLRKTWLTIFISAGVIAVASMVVYVVMPSLSIVTTLLLLLAFVLVIIAFYIDRTKMKPMRNEWTSRVGMTEMQFRDNMR